MAFSTPTKDHVVLYPSPGMGHLVSMVELGKLLARHGLAVTILIVEPPYNTGSTAPFIARTAATASPSISFHRLPAVSLPSNLMNSPNHEALAFHLLRLSQPNLLSFLRSLTPPPLALLVDFFCNSALHITTSLRLPCYCFFTSGASVLASFLHFPTLHSRMPTGISFKDLGADPVEIPGVPPIPANHMPLPMLDADDDAYKGFLDLARSLPDYDGVLVNTFSSLEPRAEEAIISGLCNPRTPPIFSIGPLITSDGRAQSGTVECLSWLESQPRRSVIFLCFGSLGLFCLEQIQEIAVGLERSGQRFLWVLRSPPTDDPTKRFKAPPEPDLDALLPKGFIERTREKGMVVKSWAPQVEVLRHEAVGGFVTHCGWNSVLEAICCGVPMVAWPLYAEQRWNKVFLVEEMRLAVEMEGFESGLVKAEEVERKIKWLMESDGGMELRKKTAAAKEAALAAVGGGGSSTAAVERVVRVWKTRGNGHAECA